MKRCPELDCMFHTEAVSWFVLESTDGPVEHVRIECHDGHTFTVAVEMMEGFHDV